MEIYRTRRFELPKKDREPIPRDLAARVLFEHDRRCCVCRTIKPVQIHHIDEDPSNNAFDNLAVLCFDCHRDTQIRGGFDRKLDADQVRLYRRDWLQKIREFRSAEQPSEQSKDVPNRKLRLTLVRLEVALANEDWFEVARVYHGVGDVKTRDKYVELALGADPSPFYVVLLRQMQGRLDEVSEEVKSAAAEAVTSDWTTYAGVLADTGRTAEAAGTYLSGISGAIQAGRWFNAAIYMRRMADDLAEPLYRMALHQAVEDEDLWWQLRCFQELKWNDAAQELLLGHASEIEAGDHELLKRALARAQGDEEKLVALTRRIEELGPAAWFQLVPLPGNSSNDVVTQQTDEVLPDPAGEMPSA